MISVLRTKSADVDFLISIEDYSELLNHLSKNGKSLCDNNIPIISKMEKPKLAVYFCRTRTFQFFDK